MQTYATFQPTGFDTRGLHADSLDRASWLVAPVTRNRDSGILDTSNWHMQMLALGGESDTVEIHRFGHWACGWFEIVLVAPESPAAEEADAIACALAAYPILDESDYSTREWEAGCAAWERASVRERLHACQRYRVSIFAARRAELPEDSSGELLGYMAGE